MQWRVESPGHTFDDNEGSVVYFDPRSGDTHLISDFAACILEELTPAPLSEAELVARLAEIVAKEQRGALNEGVGAALRELRELDLVQSR